MEQNNEKKSELIALFDMDGTLCDYNKSLVEKLNRLRSPQEEMAKEEDLFSLPSFLEERKNVITESQSFWENLPRFQLGWDVYNISLDLGYKPVILTQAPRFKPFSLSGKLIWLNKNFPSGVDFNMTRDKGLTYGKVLVDDFPPYIERWLKWRENGLVIMPANQGNKTYSHPNVIRYDGNNLEEVRKALSIAKERMPKEKLNL